MLGAPPPLISSASVFHRYPSCCSPVFLVRAAHHDLERVIRQRTLQRLGFIPRRAHPDVPLLIGRQDHRHRLGMDRLDDGVRRRRQKAVDLMRSRHRLRLGAAVALERRSRCRRSANSGRSSLSANQTTSFFLVSGFGSGAYSAKLLNGTKQRFSGFSQPRQCGDDVLRMLVTGGPPVRGGGGMPQRIMVHLVPVSALRITGAG